MRTRHNAIAGEELVLYKFFRDQLTNSNLVDLTPLEVSIFDRDPSRHKDAVAIQHPVAQQVENDPGAYQVILAVPEPGWYWDQWDTSYLGKPFTTRSSFYVQPSPNLVASDWPERHPEFTIELDTPRLLIGEVRHLVFSMSPKYVHNLELRMVSGSRVAIDWTSDLTLDGAGTVRWLIDTNAVFEDPTETLEGVYTIEARANQGREVIYASPMFLKIEQEHD